MIQFRYTALFAFSLYFVHNQKKFAERPRELAPTCGLTLIKTSDGTLC